MKSALCWFNVRNNRFSSMNVEMCTDRYCTNMYTTTTVYDYWQLEGTRV
jgi:hypothetical protein